MAPCGDHGPLRDFGGGADVGAALTGEPIFWIRGTGFLDSRMAWAGEAFKYLLAWLY